MSFFSDTTRGFAVASYVRDGYRPALPPSWHPDSYVRTNVRHPTITAEQQYIGRAELVPFDGGQGLHPDIVDKVAANRHKVLCTMTIADPQPDDGDYTPGTKRYVAYAVISERLDTGDTVDIGLVEFTPPGVVRPSRPAPYSGLPVLASLSW